MSRAAITLVMLARPADDARSARIDSSQAADVTRSTPMTCAPAPRSRSASRVPIPPAAPVRTIVRPSGCDMRRFQFDAGEHAPEQPKDVFRHVDDGAAVALIVDAIHQLFEEHHVVLVDRAV